MRSSSLGIFAHFAASAPLINFPFDCAAIFFSEFSSFFKSKSSRSCGTVYTIGGFARTESIFLTTISFLLSSISARFGFPSSFASFTIRFKSSSLSSKSSTISPCSPFVNRPFLIMSSSACCKNSIFAATSTIESYIVCSRSFKLSIAITFCSSAPSACSITFILRNSARFCEKLGQYISTNRSNSSKSHAHARYSGDCVPPAAAAASPPSASCVTLGNTCKYFKSLSVSCWYLYVPWHASHALAPLSSSNPLARSAAVKCFTSSSSYFARVFFPPPTMNLHDA
mmetsp:Transcript_8331/g.33178  ORF Transcript_8331/g.33178 Transcript_8331/m.33178 type:complete len:284 (+) Transcript_8331:3585-4436(+)